MTQLKKCIKTQKSQKKQETEVFAFCAITLEPIEVQTHSAPQNDHLNFSFVKYIYVIAKKWPQMVEKWPFLKLKFSFFFLPKLKNTLVKTICDLCHRF